MAFFFVGAACQTQQGPAAGPNGAQPKSAVETAPELQEPIDQLPASGLPGEVLEVLEGGGYTYLKVRTGSGDLWAATSKVKVDVGATVVVPRGTKMTDFQSKALGRTFKSIFFVEAIKGTVPVNPVKPASPSASGPTSAPQSGPSSATAGAPNPHEEKAVSPGANTEKPKVEVSGLAVPKGGHTVAQIFAQKTGLSGKAIKVRGAVVKVNNQIMGKNWVHIQDGSGEISKSNHDLTVTTKAEVKVGQTVVVEGTLVTDKDFGAGYAFAVIVEDAQITAE